MADDVPLAFYLPTGLFLKPDAKISIEVKLPEIKTSGVSVSNWEVMEKIKISSLPEIFHTLRVMSYTREIIHFEGEFESMRAMRKVVLLLNKKTIKLSGFSDLFKVTAKRYEPPYPTKKEWEDYFGDRGVDSFDDGKPGERPDTIRVRGLPVKWFVSRTSEGKPCPKIVTQAFQKFGRIRQVGILDHSYSTSESRQFSSFGPGAGTKSLHFDAYVQYEKYAAFCNTMSSLKGMKLIRLEDGGKEAVALIDVGFDKNAYLGERNIRKRRRAEERRNKELEEERQRKIEWEKEHERKREVTQHEEEERRVLKKAKKTEERRKKKEQQTLLVAQLKAIAVSRREEAQRLLSVLLAGAAEARYQEEEQKQRQEQEKLLKEEGEKRRREKLEEESSIRDKLIKNVQQLEQRKMEVQRELLLRNLAGGPGHLRSAVVVPPHTESP